MCPCFDGVLCTFSIFFRPIVFLFKKMKPCYTYQPLLLLSQIRPPPSPYPPYFEGYAHCHHFSSSIQYVQHLIRKIRTPCGSRLYCIAYPSNLSLNGACYRQQHHIPPLKKRTEQFQSLSIIKQLVFSIKPFWLHYQIK